MAFQFSSLLTPLSIAVLTVSDTRTPDNDSSGNCLVERLNAAGHQLAERRIVKDDMYQIRALVSQWIISPAIQVILLTGGTGFTERDSTPEAIQPLLDKEIIGFGESFRQLSWQQVGSSTIQSRALAGLANKTLIVCLPGSPNACATGWDLILQDQLDSRHKPCNLVPHLKASAKAFCQPRSA
ncbi:MAG: molybdenum cofactor biosynthesis protein B [Gammaproteobacteria bacterium]|nr:molybdenum cofactor biosynthesis protein B [Gammaproteobacteria bacterium]